jgi:hypothetical protein
MYGIKQLIYMVTVTLRFKRVVVVLKDCTGDGKATSPEDHSNNLHMLPSDQQVTIGKN